MRLGALEMTAGALEMTAGVLEMTAGDRHLERRADGRNACVRNATQCKMTTGLGRGRQREVALAGKQSCWM